MCVLYSVVLCVKRLGSDQFFNFRSKFKRDVGFFEFGGVYRFKLRFSFGFVVSFLFCVSFSYFVLWKGLQYLLRLLDKVFSLLFGVYQMFDKYQFFIFFLEEQLKERKVVFDILELVDIYRWVWCFFVDYE